MGGMLTAAFVAPQVAVGLENFCTRLTLVGLTFIMQDVCVRHVVEGGSEGVWEAFAVWVFPE